MPETFVPAQPPRPSPRARKFGARALGSLVPEVIAPALQARGFAASAVLTEWREIVGPHLAAWTSPIEIRWPRRSADMSAAKPIRAERKLDTRASRATLRIACPGAFALDLQMATPAIIAAVNRRLGFGCIGAVEIHQVPRRERQAPIRAEPPGPAAIASVERGLAAIAEPDLRHALAVLGAEITARKDR